MPKVQKVTSKKGHVRYFLTLPVEYVERKKWKQGTQLYMFFNERGNLEMEEKK